MKTRMLCIDLNLKHICYRNIKCDQIKLNKKKIRMIHCKLMMSWFLTKPYSLQKLTRSSHLKKEKGVREFEKGD